MSVREQLAQRLVATVAPRSGGLRGPSGASETARPEGGVPGQPAKFELEPEPEPADDETADQGINGFNFRVVESALKERGARN